MAKQLTLIEFIHWKMVSPLELQRALWKSDEDKTVYIRQVFLLFTLCGLFSCSLGHCLAQSHRCVGSI